MTEVAIYLGIVGWAILLLGSGLIITHYLLLWMSLDSKEKQEHCHGCRGCNKWRRE